jgi:tetratricopeptide (TPR) repeat protein
MVKLKKDMFNVLKKNRLSIVKHWSSQNGYPRDETLMVLILAFIIFIFVGATYERNRIWQDEVTLYRDTLNKSPHKSRVSVALYEGEQTSDLAIERYKSVLRLNPNYTEGHNNLAVAYKRKGMTEKAIEHYKVALKLEPNRAEIHNNLGNAYELLGLSDKAIECYERAIALNPDYATAHFNLGLTYQKAGLIDKSIKEYQIVVRIRPRFAVAQEKLSELQKEQEHRGR